MNCYADIVHVNGHIGVCGHNAVTITATVIIRACSTCRLNFRDLNEELAMFQYIYYAAAAPRTVHIIFLNQCLEHVCQIAVGLSSSHLTAHSAFMAMYRALKSSWKIAAQSKHNMLWLGKDKEELGWAKAKGETAADIQTKLTVISLSYAAFLKLVL